ncbi:MAG TPA: leucyl aminopeptidase family protein [Xanthomonadales bacterium]|nr:leucyl aminopeptidase family protein [Xanthomonadales bacterium]
MSYKIIKGSAAEKTTIALKPLDKGSFKAWQAKASKSNRQWAAASGFHANPGQLVLLPNPRGQIREVLFGKQETGFLYQLAAIYGSLPTGNYRLDCDWTEDQQKQAMLGWGLAAYRFERYRKSTKPRPKLGLPAEYAAAVKTVLDAQTLVRDLVNTPTEHLGPAELVAAVETEAAAFGARTRTVTGDDLLEQNFPAIHAVGRASHRPPMLVELDWGDESHPLLALVGKGVCFDTGGLDLKNSSGMALMKKDMGGAAHALALARLVMQAQLPVRLKLLIPAVENSVAGNAYRPGDVIPTRKGLHIEIGNTDAEGRVVLSDALAYASESRPDLIVDFATLTGAARVALGTDLPALFSNSKDVARVIQDLGDACEDPLWNMPLYRPYRDLIKSPIADINNSGKSPYGGCITAALFLEYFVPEKTDWVHLDTFAWNASSRPGRPEGGDALGLRALFEYLKRRYA